MAGLFGFESNESPDDPPPAEQQPSLPVHSDVDLARVYPLHIAT